MDLNQITYFIHLAETLSFTEAARRSGVSQPSLTKGVRRLEEELGGQLIHRDGKDSRLTTLGRQIQTEFLHIHSLLNGVQELAESSVTGRKRTLVLGIATTIAPGAIADFLTYALEQLPGVKLHIEPLLANEGEAEVLSGKYDACVLPTPPKLNFKLATVCLFRERLLAAVATDHPLAALAEVSPEQMSKEPYLDRLRCNFRTQMIENLMDQKIVMHPRIQSEREDLIQKLVATGVGICVLPERSAIVDGIVLRPISGTSLTRDVTLVSISGSSSPMEMRQIMEMAEAFNWE